MKLLLCELLVKPRLVDLARARIALNAEQREVGVRRSTTDEKQQGGAEGGESEAANQKPCRLKHRVHPKLKCGKA